MGDAGVVEAEDCGPFGVEEVADEGVDRYRWYGVCFSDSSRVRNPTARAVKRDSL